MCGICGVVLTDPATEIDAQALRAASAALMHRGPDASGEFIGGGAGLAMRRLSIIDVFGGMQPVHSEDGRVHAVVNGEIYNHLELRTRLVKRGHVFVGGSDAEVVPHLYEEHGPAFVDHLRGMFSIGLWDERQERLVLCLDRLGIKPLYYFVDHRGIAFASELAATLELGPRSRRLDWTAIAEYLTLGSIAAPRSIYRDILKLEPGHLLTWTRREGARDIRYWDLPRAADGRGTQACPDPSEVRERLRDAVQSHLMSDVPLGAFLSGGLDSSSIVAMMSEAGVRPLKTFSIGFADRSHDELPLARQVADRYGTEHHEIILEPGTVDVLPQIVERFGEPFGDSSALPTYYVSKAAAGEVKVALSGDGGDESFLGYTLFQGMIASETLGVLPSSVRSVLQGRLQRGREAAAHRRWLGIERWTGRLADSLCAPAIAYCRKKEMPGLGSCLPFLRPPVRRRVLGDGLASMRAAFEAFDQTGPANSRMEKYVYTGFKVGLASDMLTKVDRMSMASSLEVRVPLLDHELVEFLSRIPLRDRLGLRRLKPLLREAMRDDLPDDIISAPKRGFTVPLEAWFTTDLNAYAQEVFFDRQSGDGFVDSDAILPILRGKQPRPPRWTTILWSLLVLELWRAQAHVTVSG